MPFLSLSVVNFRNLDFDTINLLGKEVYFVGENGQGKSNILEAIYMSSYASSFRTRNENEIIKDGYDSYCVKGFFKENNEKTDIIKVSYSKSKKVIEKNNKKIKDRKELLNTIPCVLFCHDDLDFAVGEPERRRFFIDQSLSMYDEKYLDTLRKYRHILKSRNSIIKEQSLRKENNRELIELYNPSLIREGISIQKKRKQAICQFNRIFGKIYCDVTGIDNVSLMYDPSWKMIDENEINDFMIQKYDTDRIMNTTFYGPHRDKIKFVRNKQPFIPTASTGQRRLSALILRIAQATYYTEITEKKPVLLMDDVFLELDPDKREKIISLLPEYDQMFCTFLPGEPYNRYMKSTTKIFNINKGKWYE
ncbi:MAG: DNA replication and repair protein RecF [Treponemataceae bacterium]|nr:DNA replication and repair protein RecF [Treponemataceae bacterium]